MKPTRIGKVWCGILRMAAVVWVTAGMLLFAFEQPVFAAQPIKVGVLTFLSGKLKPIGDEIVTGIQTAVKMQGPVLGRPIELVLEDSLVNAQVAVTKGTKLVQRHRVVAILGTSTLEALALLPVADRLRVPIITSNSGSAVITGEKCNYWVFQTNPTPQMAVAAMRHLISQNPKLRTAKWFTLGHDYPWSRRVARSVKIVKGVTYVGETFAPLDTTDWAPFIAKVRSAGATAVVIPVTLGTPLVQFIQQANEFGLTKEAVLVAPIGLPDWLIAKLGKLSTSIISAGAWSAWRLEDRQPVTRKFNELYFKMHSRVAGMQAIQAGTAAMMLFTAIEEARSLNGDAIIKALETLDILTPAGRLHFQPNGRMAEVPLILGKIERLKKPKYGAQFAQSVEILSSSESLLPAKQLGCRLKK
jgi:branched-chain amino acid transport system substrate-binding protein